MDGWRALACAVIVKAVEDACSLEGCRREARDWLRDIGLDWLSALGIEVSTRDLNRLLSTGRLKRRLKEAFAVRHQGFISDG